MPKVVRLKTGEVLHEKVSMSPRPPPKISLKQDWTRELGSKIDRQPEGEVARQPEGEVAQQAKNFPTNSKSNSWHNCATCWFWRQDESQCWADSWQNERCDLLLFFIQLQHKTTLNYVMKPIRSTLMMKYFVKMEKIIAVHDENHEPMMVNEADMDFRIPGLPNSVLKYAQSTSVRQLIQKIENQPDRHALQQDLQQNQTLNPFSPESTQMVRDVGNIELCELLETEPKTHCKVCWSYWNFGILSCTCGNFSHKERGANQQFINYTMDLLSVPEYVIKTGRPHGHRYGKSRETRNSIRPISWRSSARRSSSRASIIDSYEIQNSVNEWLKIIETKNFAEKGMLLRMKIILTIWPQKNTRFTRVTGGIIRTSKVPILCERRTDLTSKKALSTLQQLKQEEEGAFQRPTNSDRNQHCAQNSSSWWNWQGSWWTPYSFESHDGDETKYWQNGCTVFGIILLGNTFLNSITLLQMDRLQLTSVYCNRRVVSIIPQMTCFRGAKVCRIWLDDQFIRPDNKVIIGTKSGNSELAMIAW